MGHIWAFNTTCVVLVGSLENSSLVLNRCFLKNMFIFWKSARIRPLCLAPPPAGMIDRLSDWKTTKLTESSACSLAQCVASLQTGWLTGINNWLNEGKSERHVWLANGNFLNWEQCLLTKWTFLANWIHQIHFHCANESTVGWHLSVRLAERLEKLKK